MKKSIFIGILICLVAIVGAYYIFQKERPSDTVANVSPSSATVQQTKETAARESININNSSDENDIKIDEMGDTVSTCDFNYTVNSVIKRKDLGEYPKDMINYFNGEEIDENGMLISDHSYIFINMTVENTLNTPAERYLNSCGLIPNVDALAYGYSEEMRFFDKGLDANAKDYFRHEFMGNEKQTYNVGFIVKDEDFASDNLLMIINPLGRYPYDETSRYISLHY